MKQSSNNYGFIWQHRHVTGLLPKRLLSRDLSNTFLNVTESEKYPTHKKRMNNAL